MNSSNVQVLALINGLIPDGAERSLAELAPRVRELGIDVTIVCLYEQQGNVYEQLYAKGFDVKYLEADSFLGRILELRRLFHVLSPDLVHTTIIESDIIGRLAGVGTGIPVVTSLVNTSYDSRRLDDPNVAGWKLKLIRAVDAFTARHMGAGFHALTAAVADASEESLGVSRESITVIGRSREPDRLGRVTPHRRLTVRQALGLDKSHEVVLATGRQDYQKGHVTLVEATARLVASRPRLRVLLAGRPGSETERIDRRIGALGLTTQVLILGHREDVPDLLAAADLYVFPSLFEGFGGALLEAMAVGLPAIASDLPALREVGGPCIEYVKSGDVTSWANSIDRLLEDEASRRRLGKCARRRVAERFSVANIAEAYADWYRRMV